MLASIASLVSLFTLVPTVFGAAAKVPMTKATTSPSYWFYLRVEGAQTTLWEWSTTTSGHPITTYSGGTHNCDGTNNGLHANPLPTVLSGTMDANQIYPLAYDGTWNATAGDYNINMLAGEYQGAAGNWEIMVDYVTPPTGGCQTQVNQGQEVVWAIGASKKKHWLRLSGPTSTPSNHPATFYVWDGKTGLPVQGATLNGGTTDATGHVTITFSDSQKGYQYPKAWKEDDSVRSNWIVTYVY